MSKKILWLKWEDPLYPKKHEDSAEVQSQKDSFYDSEKDDDVDRHVRVIMGPYGTIPINENSVTSKLYNMWVGHCDFNITQNIMGLIEGVEGVEILRVWTRYRFWIGFGNLFEDSLIQKNIEEVINPKIKNKNLSIEALIRVLSKKYKNWIIFSLKNNEIKTLGSEELSDILEIRNNKSIMVIASSIDTYGELS